MCVVHSMYFLFVITCMRYDYNVKLQVSSTCTNATTLYTVQLLLPILTICHCMNHSESFQK